MSIKYRFAIEHPVGLSLSLCLGFIAVFFIWVNVMTAGFYGYWMSGDTWLPLIVLAVYFGFEAEIKKQISGASITYRWFGVPLKSKHGERIAFELDGKIWRMVLKREKELVGTGLCFSMTAVDHYRSVFTD